MQRTLSSLVLVAALVVPPVAADNAALLVYQVRETGVEPYISRVLVSDDSVRLDEGTGSFTLFDRAQEIVYNVDVENQVVYVMSPASTLDEQPASLVLQAQTSVDEAAPKVAGRQPTEVRLLANGELCSELVVIADVMADARNALGELKETVSRVQADAVKALPLSERTPCDLAELYDPARSLSFGLPLVEHSEGRIQTLVDFAEQHEVDAGVFELPAGYARRPMLAPAI